LRLLGLLEALEARRPVTLGGQRCACASPVKAPAACFGTDEVAFSMNKHGHRADVLLGKAAVYQ
jgi:hypothetical protein